MKKLLVSVREKIQEKILWADELVFFFPLWWGDMPAILKNFFDCNFTVGFAYKFEGKLLPRKLLSGKIARVFITADGSKLFQYLLCFPLKKILQYVVLGFCGVKVSSFLLFDRMMKRDETSRLQLLQQFAQFAQK